MENGNVTIIGLGWLGEPLAVHLNQLGYTIKGTTTSFDKLSNLSQHPFYVTRVLTSPEGIEGDWETLIHQTDVLVINIPPRRVEDIEAIYPAQIEQIIAKTPSTVKVIFVSSTAVYQSNNTKVTEKEECKPEKPSGVAVLRAERTLQAHFDKNVTILRLAGLIGPERHPGKFLANKKALKNPSVPVNLIHLEDCIHIIQKIIERNCFGEIINGCADQHPIRKEYYTEASKELGLALPTFQSGEEQPYKIVDNKKSKELLQHSYIYKDPKDIFKKKNFHPVSIVGAGPGDINLLTLQAHQLIVKADIILYDNLVSEQIMKINAFAEKIYVGRKFGDSGNQNDRQIKINTLIHSYYKEGKKVVRLKSGDPYIYGRAAEEARYLKEEKVPFQVVAGISAALAAANLCNIPITERGKSKAVLICTAHTANYTMEQINWMGDSLRQGNTLAVYMGLKSLHEIVKRLVEACENTAIPIHAISNVSRPEQVILSSTLGNIEQDIKKHPLKMPVTFLIGVEAI